MSTLSFTQKKEALNNALVHYSIPSKYFVHMVTGGSNVKFALATSTELGGIFCHSSFMTYDEMNCYLMGYNRAFTNPLI